MPKTWNWGVFWGWGLAGILGGGFTGALFTYLTSASDVVFLWTTWAGTIGAGGGFIGGAGGVLLSHWLDEPLMRWTPKSALLFGTVVTVLLFSLLSFPSLSYFSERHDKLYAFIAVVAQFQAL